MSTPAERSGRRTETALRVGAGMVGVGVVATIATLTPLLLGADPLPVGVYLLCFLAPLGIGVILVTLWARARMRSKAMRALSQDHHP